MGGEAIGEPGLHCAGEDPARPEAAWAQGTLVQRREALSQLRRKIMRVEEPTRILSDSGAPAYDHDNAAALAHMGVPVFACSPDKFPDLMAAAISGLDLSAGCRRGALPPLRNPSAALR